MKSLSLKNKRFGKEEKGLVGVGVLIIFISIVIVATVAAGILINTSVSLQGKARDTAEKAMQKVSTGVRVLSVTGTTNADSQIENLSLVLERRVGSSGIDLTKTVVSYQSKETNAYLKYSTSGKYPADFYSSLTGDNFAVVKIRNPTGTEENILGEGADLCEIQINCAVVESGSNGLEKSEDVTLTVIPDKGFKTIVKIQIPTTLTKNETYSLR